MGELTQYIAGVSIQPLRIISDERGAVMHMLRVDDPEFAGFGEVYFSKIKAGLVKAWKRHRSMVQSFAVPVGAIRLVIFDDRPGSQTRGEIQKIETGLACERYELVRVPAMVWYGFSGLGDADSLIANCASLTHDPDEVDRLSADSPYVPYKWI